jgi:cytochrome b6
MNSRPVSWFETRLPLRGLVDLMGRKRVPAHRYSIWYYFGGMTLFLFLIQVGTGALLLLYYRPSASEAYESVRFIMTRVPFGWLVRSIHAWSANLMIAAAAAHLLSVLFLHAYRRPRELTWMSGVLLLVLTLAFGFTGYLLPWNELSFFATRVGTDIAATVPVVGHFMVRFLRGGDDVTGATLTRLFGVHVAILPALATGLLVLHLLLVQVHGMSLPPSVERQHREGGQRIGSIPFFPHFVLRDLFAWTVALACLAGLSAFYPWELGAKANPFAPAPAGIRPEWYFLWMFESLQYVPASIAGVSGELLVVAAVVLGGAALFVLPLMVGENAQLQRLVRYVTTAVLLFMTLMTILALRASPEVVP